MNGLPASSRNQLFSSTQIYFFDKQKRSVLGEGAKIAPKSENKVEEIHPPTKKP